LNKKLVYNSLSGIVLYTINICVAFIMSPVIIKFLGNRDYGLWEMVMSVIGYMGLLDLGIGPALVTFISNADGKQDYKDMQHTMSTAFVFFFVLGSVALLFFIILGFFPQLIAGSEVKSIYNLSIVFFLLGINIIMVFPLQVFITTLIGMQRHYFINSIRAIIAIMTAVITYKLIHIYPTKGLIILAVLLPIFTLIQFILFWGAIRIDKKIPSMTASAVSWTKMKELFDFGLKSTVMLIASRLQNQSVPLIIGKVIGLGSVVYFVLPNRLIVYAKGFSTTIGFPLIPFFGATIGKGDDKKVQSAWLQSSLVLQIVALPMPVIIFFCGEIFISLWIGPEYSEKGRWVLYYLLIGLTFESFSNNAYRILIAKAAHGRCATVWLILAVISIPCSIVTGKIWGVSGVALTMTIVTSLGNIFALQMACKVMKISLVIYFKETVLLLLYPLLSMILVFCVVSQYTHAESYQGLLLQLIIVGIVYLSFVWRFTLNPISRKLIIDYISIVFSSLLKKK